MCDRTLTIRQLLDFQPDDDREKEIYNINKHILHDMNNKLQQGAYYLGGQIKMSYDDNINMNVFDEVREINKKRLIEYGGPCNTWEAMSMHQHNTTFNETEIIFKKYCEVMKSREVNSPPHPPF